MNQYSRYIDTNLACVVKEGESYVIPSQREITAIKEKLSVSNQRGRNFLSEGVLFSNYIVLWHVVLPSMPKREIVGYNCLIVCCL